MGVDYDGTFLDFLFKVWMCGDVLMGTYISQCGVNIANICDRITFRKRTPLTYDAWIYSIHGIKSIKGLLCSPQ